MRIYTKTGDDGTTGLLGGGRVSKHALRLHAVGEADELNSFVGIARTYSAGTSLDDSLSRIQCWLFDLGAELASSPTAATPYVAIALAHVEYLERSIDQMTAELPPLAQFILPGGTSLAANLHVARAVCRRMERTILELHDKEGVSNESRMFVNRLSDWFFTAARYANQMASVEDVTWKSVQAE